MTSAASVPPTTAWERVAAIVVTLCRVALGALWINEALVKWRSGFGSADILLVVQSTAHNPRVPEFYKLFTANALGTLPGLFGFAVPIIEFMLGVAFVLGVFTLPAALASIGQLCMYWFADQLIVEYPIMIALSTVVAVFALSATRYSLTALLETRRRRPFPAAARRWL